MPAPPPDRNELTAAREAERAREIAATERRAREAFVRGVAAGEAGRHDAAVRELDRAHRLARGDQTIGFALALARLRTGDPAGAASLLLGLPGVLDLRQGLIALALARRRQGLARQAAAHLADTLSRQTLDVADPSLPPIADAIAAEAGFDGWAGLADSGGILLRAARPLRCRLLLDGVAVGPDPVVAGRGGDDWVVALPPGWRRAGELRIEAESGVRLLVERIDVRSIGRTEGLVAPDGTGGLVGWAWCPNAPEHVPLLGIADDDLVPLRTLPCDGTVEPEFVEHRFGMVARGFRLPARSCPPGPLRVVDERGTELAGSPVEPRLELEAVAASGAADGAAMRRFFPVRAELRGERPLQQTRSSRRRPPPVAIVIPVFDGRRQTLRCLDAVAATVPPATPVHVVDDGSTDPALARDLAALARAGRIRLHRHRDGRNLGFPVSVNRGIAEAAGHDIVLLNSDTRPAGDWLGRLRRAARSDFDIASATPFASEGSILAFPVPGRANPVPSEAEGERLALHAAAANDASRVEIPVGVGFCLYLRRDALDAVGPFREDVFGRGYGEENDWSLRARHAGWRHVAALDSYVAHEGGASFGAARRALMRRNERTLNRLHPGYDRLVASFVASDPLAEGRRRLDEARIVDRTGDMSSGTVLLVTHSAGGGVERFVGERIARARRNGERVLVLRPDPDGFRGDLAFLSDGSDPGGHPNLRYALPDDTGRLVAMLDRLSPTRIEIHHLLRHHEAVADLCRSRGVPVAVYLHDYALFCHRIALFGPERRYCGEPDRAGCRSCVAELGSLLDEQGDVDALLDRSAVLLRAATELVAPSEDVAQRFRCHFPALGPIGVEPWEAEPEPAATARRSSEAGRTVRIVVPGGLGPEKGVELLVACARDARRRALPLRFAVVGYTSMDDELVALGVELTGPYDRHEAVGLLRRSDADLAFLPSLWPETWSFVLTECLAAGLAVAAFALGTPAERLAGAGRGILLPVDLAPGAVNDRLLEAALGARFPGESDAPAWRTLAEASSSSQTDETGTGTINRLCHNNKLQLPAESQASSKRRRTS